MNKDILKNINMNCVLYLRVSSEEQVENYSLSNQESTCRKVAESRGLNILEIFREEGASAKTANRPELIKLLEYCRKHKDNIALVMFYRIDRLARQISDYLTIKRKLFELGI
ncbi:recombinase family protein, partial [Candidatus Collierbacteria bacterium CG_4_10_14_0_8_um_filter_43_86]